MAESKQGAETGAEKDAGPNPGVTTTISPTPPPEKSTDDVVLAPANPMTTLEIPVQDGKSIVLVADGTPVPRAMVEHVVKTAALCREPVVAIDPDEGHILLTPA